MMIPSPLSALIKTSVLINGVWVQGRQAATSLQRYCRPVCFFNESSPYELSTAGSCFLFKYGARRLVFFTRHQLGKATAARKAAEFCILVDDAATGAKLALTPNAVASPTYADANYRFAEDIQFVEYDETRDGRELGGHFVDIDFAALPDLRSVPKQNLVAIFAIGYPSASASYDFDYDHDFNPRNVEVVYRFGKLVFSNDWREGMELHLELRQHERYPETIADMDGFSGSPVFFFYKDQQSQVHLGFAGMIRLGGNGLAHVFEAGHMKQLLGQAFSSGRPA